MGWISTALTQYNDYHSNALIYNTGTVTRAIDHDNDLQYDYTYDSTDRLISSTITNSNNNQRKVMFEYNFDLNNNMSKFITLTPTGEYSNEMSDWLFIANGYYR